eukprot:6994600-Karenia_brevis.AAC.1
MTRELKSIFPTQPSRSGKQLPQSIKQIRKTFPPVNQADHFDHHGLSKIFHVQPPSEPFRHCALDCLYTAPFPQQPHLQGSSEPPSLGGGER